MNGPDIEYTTLSAKPDQGSIIKPGEMIDIVEVSPLTLADRRIYNQLIGHAWDKIDQPVEHAISKKDLRGSHNVNDRVGESIRRLMGAIVEMRIELDGEPTTQRVAILGANRENNKQDGMFYYTFPEQLRLIIKESRVFARLRTDIMFALTSKYALALYEIIEKRGRLRFKTFEDFEITELRGLLGVPKGKLERFADLNKYAIKPAVEEVNALSDYVLTLVALKNGRRIEKLRVGWRRKTEEELKTAFREMKQPRVGRRARIQGQIEHVFMTR